MRTGTSGVGSSHTIWYPSASMSVQFVPRVRGRGYRQTTQKERTHMSPRNVPMSTAPNVLSSGGILGRRSNGSTPAGRAVVALLAEPDITRAWGRKEKQGRSGGEAADDGSAQAYIPQRPEGAVRGRWEHGRRGLDRCSWKVREERARALGLPAAAGFKKEGRRRAGGGKGSAPADTEARRHQGGRAHSRAFR